ncbi:protease complex subunit PrcB family protein [Flavobacterium agrisoli]|uniref:Protease complex subunit PrcB family protein n=1 Tax=Flavobacterium agrisoli TaxID=2793066 RepID=A0A934PKV4_9FLAO|nr:protease complex subunit PrcB family protein [Flavobacterium agrisoli]MBK0368218.1 protease complex subunit PrcB family protein [Flavobacterium agrisoli]
MKKIIALFTFLSLFSCQTTQKSTAKKGSLYEVLTEQSNGGGNIQFYEILTEPQEIKMLLNDEFLKNKIKESDIQNANFVILNMGEKNTSGYSIGVSKVEETPTEIIVTVQENKPSADSMVMQVVSYPYTVLKINSKKPIKIL